MTARDFFTKYCIIYNYEKEDLIRISILNRDNLKEIDKIIVNLKKVIYRIEQEQIPVKKESLFKYGLYIGIYFLLGKFNITDPFEFENLSESEVFCSTLAFK